MIHIAPSPPNLRQNLQYFRFLPHILSRSYWILPLIYREFHHNKKRANPGGLALFPDTISYRENDAASA
jgi:hypothetical protein